jgi:hypothetical protein
VNIAWPSPQIVCITFRACPGYCLRIERIMRLWKTPSIGMW